MERRHKGIRKYGTLLCNTQAWEASLLKSAIAEHMHLLGEESNLFRMDTFLEDLKTPSKKMMASLYQFGVVPAGVSCKYSRCCRLASGATITCGDVVYLHSDISVGHPIPFQAAQVHYHLSLPAGGSGPC